MKVLTAIKGKFTLSESKTLTLIVSILVQMKDNGNPHTLLGETAIEFNPFVKQFNCLHVCSIKSNSLQPHGLQPTRLFCPWNFPGKNTGVGCHLLQRIFLTQGSNLCLLSLLHQPVDSFTTVPLEKHIIFKSGKAMNHNDIFRNIS